MRFIPVRVMASFLVSTLALWILAPLTTLRLAERGVDPTWIGVFGSLPWAAVMALAPIAPRVIGRLGPLTAYRLGLVLAGLGLRLVVERPRASVPYEADTTPTTPQVEASGQGSGAARHE